MIPSYTCLDQSSPEPAADLQNIVLDHQRIAHRLYPIINQQHAFQCRQYTKQCRQYTKQQAIIRTIHQTVENKYKSLSKYSTQRYDHINVKFTKIGIKT